ncbi:hypothetical protein [Facklamia sp. P12955]|uniref:hypothetical protein n=1 Tax=unclassified Facklamia TaxID=2622293 RepID=UPI003D16247B
MNQRFLKGSRDSLGVPLEPDEDLPVAKDWKGEALYEGDSVIEFDGDLIYDEPTEIAEYFRQFDRYELRKGVNC